MLVCFIPCKAPPKFPTGDRPGVLVELVELVDAPLLTGRAETDTHRLTPLSWPVTRKILRAMLDRPGLLLMLAETVTAERSIIFPVSDVIGPPKGRRLRDRVDRRVTVQRVESRDRMVKPGRLGRAGRLRGRGWRSWVYWASARKQAPGGAGVTMALMVRLLDFSGAEPAPWSNPRRLVESSIALLVEVCELVKLEAIEPAGDEATKPPA